MPGNSFGTLFRITTAGESHGPGYVVIVDGCPPGMALSVDDLLPDLARRRPGQSRLTTQRDEPDTPEILGVFEGRTTGTPIAILIRNRDQRSGDYSEIRDKYRPGHADFTFDAKFGFRDYRGGGRASAREAVCRVAAGAIAKKLLATTQGVRIVGYVRQVGGIIADIADPAAVTLEQVESNAVRCPDPRKAREMTDLIERVRKEQDSIGGVAEVVATGVPAGWGEPVFDKLKADLGKALLSLPAVVGVEYGNGFAAAQLRGSQNNDPFVPALSDQQSGVRDQDSGVGAQASPAASLRAAGVAGQQLPQDPTPDTRDPKPEPRSSNSQFKIRHSPFPITTSSNRHGGMLGGISTGLPIILRCAVKPTSSIPQPQQTVTTTGQPTTITTKGRHDPCVLPRLVPMAEAMVALVLADHMLRQRAIS